MMDFSFLVVANLRIVDLALERNFLKDSKIVVYVYVSFSFLLASWYFGPNSM